MEKSDTKNTITIDSTKDSKYNVVFQILLLVLAIALGVTLAFRVFYVDREDNAVLLDPKFQIQAVSPSSFSVLTGYIHPLILHNHDSWNLTFSIRNPNSNYDLYYDNLKASISYNNTILWSANASDKFHQDAKAQTTIDSMFAALPESYAYWIGTSIAGDFASGQTTRFSILLLILAIALGVALAFRVFHVHEDTTTVLHDPKFQIEAVSPSSFSVSTRYIHPLILHNPDNWNLTFSVQNPNGDYDFYYDDIKTGIFYNNTLLWSANAASGKFYQDAKGQTTIDSTFAALPESYEYWICTSIAGDFASGQTTRFSISLSGKIQISDHKSPSHRNCREFHVSCEGLRVEFPDDIQTGVLAIDSKACVVISQDSGC
ncbi:hypothetical protein HAX54_014896 [Datura stramonium]|uniref:Late embryogenesis abundant protein LEA-2 subgroup domain-containing protein n=1 Tax=Datura stramonium TaxID=4076 RepID=A0ABS8RYZ4_DATST|nr:hypothetical protein [Datura stramonium]